MLSHCPHRQGEKDRGILGSFTKKTGCLAEVKQAQGGSCCSKCVFNAVFSTVGSWVPPGPAGADHHEQDTQSRVLPRALSIHQTRRELGVCGPTNQGWSGHSSEH